GAALPRPRGAGRGRRRDPGRPMTSAASAWNTTLGVLRAPPRAVARAIRSVRTDLDRRLHGFRHRRVLRRLAAMAAPRSVLFVCHGNICRSPYAEHRFRATVAVLGAAAPRAGSAGFIGPDRPAPDEAIAAAAGRGL